MRLFLQVAGLTLLIVLLVSAAVLFLMAQMTVTVNQPAAPECKCPPPLTQEQEEALAKQEQCVRFKRYFLNTFGSLPYDPCPTPTAPPVDGQGRPIP